MPRVRCGDIDCYYRLDGRESAPALILSHSLGQDHGMWDPQMTGLRDHFRVLRYDTRGHGSTSAPANDYTLTQLADDVIALARALQMERFFFCGLSLGGQIGQELASRRDSPIDKLVLANTSPRIADPAAMETRRRAVLEGGLVAVADMVMARFFTPDSLEEDLPLVASARRILLATDPVGYAGCCAALRDADLAPNLAAIHVPVLVISGDEDAAMPWTGHGDQLLRGIAGARAIHLPAGHLSNLEMPEAFTSALIDFLR